MRFFSYLRLSLYFLSTLILFLLSLLPIELVILFIVDSALQNDFLILFLSPVLILIAYLFFIVIFVIIHSQIVCRIFLPNVVAGEYSHTNLEQGHLFGVAMGKDGLAKSMIKAVEWIPFVSQVFLKQFLLGFYGLKTGKNVYLATQTWIDTALTTIGDGSFIGYQSIITNHLNEKGRIVIAPVTIGKNCTIGGNALISPGVEIGDNVVIGACCFVPKFKKLPSNTIWFGVPARQYIPKEKKLEPEKKTED